MHRPCESCDFLITTAEDVLAFAQEGVWWCGMLDDFHVSKQHPAAINYDENDKTLSITQRWKGAQMDPFSLPPEHCPFQTEIAVCIREKPANEPPISDIMVRKELP